MCQSAIQWIVFCEMFRIFTQTNRNFTMKRIFALIVAINSLCGCLNEKDYAESAIDPKADN